MLREFWSKQVPYPYTPMANAFLLAARILATVQLLPNGLRKLADFGQIAAAMGGEPQVIGGRLFPEQTPLVYFPLPELFLAASVGFDMVLSLLIIIGWKARTAGLLLAGYVLVAITIYHSDIRGPQDLQAVMRNLPFVASLLMIAALGAGRWSLDGALPGQGRQ